jgi:acyl-CoA thioesterase FadM
MFKKRILFLVVEQTITYSRPIMPFQKYVVSTNVKVSDDDKWMYYTHSFNAPADPKSNLPPVHHALITLKAVLKESGGRTVKPSDAFSSCDYHEHISTK